MSNIIDSIKVSGVTYEIQGGSITVDPTLDSGSTNPVANSAITTALDAKVNVADNEVSGVTVVTAIGVGEEFAYGKVNKITVKSTVSSGSGTRTVNFYCISSNGLPSLCTLKYQYSNTTITSITSTSGNFTATLNNGAIDITFSSGYSFNLLYASDSRFAVYGYLVYDGGQSADVLEGSVGQAITDVAAKIPPTILTDASLSISNSNGSITLRITDQAGSNININRPLYDRKTLKYDNTNGLYVNFYGETAHTVTLNTSNGNYCMIPDVTSSYKDGLDSITVRVNSGYTGSTSSFTWKLNGVDYSGTTYENTYTYDKTNNTVTLSGSSTFNVSVTNDGYYFTFTPTDTNTRIWRFYETNCNIAGTGNTIPNAYIIDLVQALTYQYNGQEVIDDIYSKLDTKQTTLTAGTGISIVDNVISATGGSSITVDSSLNSGSTNPVQNKALYDELRIVDESATLLEWEQEDGGHSINYPSGCTKITVEVDENEMTYGGYTLYNDNYDCFGNFNIESNGGVITIETLNCEYEPTTSITYSISGNVVTIEYPTITNVTIIGTAYDNYWTIKAIGESVTPLIDQVTANTVSIQGKQDTLSAGTNITISGNVISAEGGGGNPTVELTQAEYDALVTAGTVSADTYYIITDAQGGDLSNYYTKTETNTLLGGKADTATTYTKTEVDNAITSATSTKQDTLISGTNIKTINNTSILGSGNIDIQGGGGGGKAIEAGRGISITTGETADTVSFNLPISAGTGNYSIIEGYSTSAMSMADHAEGRMTYANGGSYTSHAEGYQTSATSSYCHSEGRGTKATSEACHAEGKSTVASGDYSHAEGNGTIAMAQYSHSEGAYTTASSVINVSGIQAYQGCKSRHTEGSYTFANNGCTHTEGYWTQANNFGEHASGVYNVSNSATTTYGDSGNTLFSVGNGTSTSARHNAFEIRQNGDIYITINGQDVKLQDILLQLSGTTS